MKQQTSRSVGLWAVLATAALFAQGSNTTGPKDGLDLPATDLDRVAVGSPAPDFTLETSKGEFLTLSDFLGKRNLILVFYRGHW